MTPAPRRLLAAIVAASLGLVACSTRSSETSESEATGATGAPATVARTSTSVPPRVPSGHAAAVIRVERPDGTTVEGCALLADTPDQRARGLMEVDSLGGYDGMLFRFERPSTGRFYMYRTLLPLSIAFFDAAGLFVSSTDMEPCRSGDPAACPRYGADAPFSSALEVSRGDLGRLGIGPGSRLAVAGSCARP